MLVGFGMRTLRVIPLTALSGGRAFVAVRALKTFRLDPNPNRPLENRQMPQGNCLIVTMKLINGAPAATAHGSLARADHRNH